MQHRIELITGSGGGNDDGGGATEGNNKLRASESFNDSFGVECRLAKSKGLPTSASGKESAKSPGILRGTRS